MSQWRTLQLEGLAHYIFSLSVEAGFIRVFTELGSSVYRMQLRLEISSSHVAWGIQATLLSNTNPVTCSTLLPSSSTAWSLGDMTLHFAPFFCHVHYFCTLHLEVWYFVSVLLNDSGVLCYNYFASVEKASVRVIVWFMSLSSFITNFINMLICVWDRRQPFSETHLNFKPLSQLAIYFNCAFAIVILFWLFINYTDYLGVYADGEEHLS